MNILQSLREDHLLLAEIFWQLNGGKHEII